MVDESSREAAKECSPRRKPWAGLIFSTRERHPLIKPEFRSELFAYLGGIVREMHGTALIISGTADHVHMLVRTHPARAPAELAWRRKNKFLSLGSRKMEPKFWMANRLRSFQRQRIECHRRKEIYCQPGRTSQEAFISG